MLLSVPFWTEQWGGEGGVAACILVDLGRFPLTRREIPLEGWRFFFFFGSIGRSGLMERIYIYIYMDEIDLVQVFLFKA